MTLSPLLGSASLMCNLAPLLCRTWLMTKPPCTQPGASQIQLIRSIIIDHSAGLDRRARDEVWLGAQGSVMSGCPTRREFQSFTLPMTLPVHATGHSIRSSADGGSPSVTAASAVSVWPLRACCMRCLGSA